MESEVTEFGLTLYHWIQNGPANELQEAAQSSQQVRLR